MKSERRVRAAVVAAVLLVAGLAWATGEILNVQVRTTQLRSRASFLGSTVAQVDYGARMTLVSRRGPWVQVTTPDGRSGWLHESALSKDKLAMVSGTVEADAGASGEEIALAGKGFNDQVENEYQKQHQDLDYTWVDLMEAMVVSPEQAETFLTAGQIRPTEGGR